MIVVTIRMKMQFTVLKEHVHKIHSDVQIIVVSLPHGIVMEMMIAAMVLMNHQNIVNPKEERALEIYSLVIMEIAFQEFTFVMVTI